MSEYLKDKNQDHYGDDAAKNQALFDKEMSEVVDRKGFNQLHERLNNASLIGMNGVGMRRGGVHFSKSQSAKVIGWSRDSYANNGSGDYNLVMQEIDMTVVDMIKLGSANISLTEEDIDFCLHHYNGIVRHQACWHIDLNSHHINKILDCYAGTRGTLVSMPGIIIERYAKSLSAEQIEKIQLTCEMDDCCSLWYAGFGDMPIKNVQGISKDGLVFSIKENFLNWRNDYKAKLEAEKLKRLSFVSDLVQSNGIKSIHKAVL